MTSLFRIPTLLLSVGLIFTGFALPSKCVAWSLASQPVEGLLVLRNGNVLRGRIQLLGNRYHVYLDNGKLQIPDLQVEHVCENLEAAYQHRCQTHGGTTADAHLELAAWCLRHDLFDHARHEIAAAKADDADHPRLLLLERQLKQSIRLAEFRQQLETAQASPKPELPPIDPELIDKAPKWARALFVRQIQPLIVHSCATGGCHQSGTTAGFQLNRLALDGAGHSGLTLRNLASALEQINWEVADESTLLTHAKRAHGSEASSNPLPPHKLQVLHAWIHQLAEAEGIKQQQLATAAQSAPDLTGDGTVAKTEPAPAVRLASLEQVDPFDPSAFNRRFAAPAQKNDTHSVPHVLAPSDPVPTLLPATE